MGNFGRSGHGHCSEGKGNGQPFASPLALDTRHPAVGIVPTRSRPTKNCRESSHELVVGGRKTMLGKLGWSDPTMLSNLPIPRLTDHPGAIEGVNPDLSMVIGVLDRVEGRPHNHPQPQFLLKLSAQTGLGRFPRFQLTPRQFPASRKHHPFWPSGDQDPRPARSPLLDQYPHCHLDEIAH